MHLVISTDNKEFKMTTEITQQEAWRILDAIIAYKDDYELSVSVIKTIKNIEKKMEKIVNEK